MFNIEHYRNIVIYSLDRTVRITVDRIENDRVLLKCMECATSNITYSSFSIEQFVGLLILADQLLTNDDSMDIGMEYYDEDEEISSFLQASEDDSGN